MAKHTLSLSDVLTFAKANNLDTSDLEACKAAYRESLKVGEKDTSEAKRAWNRRLVSLAVIVPIDGKNDKHLTFHNLENDRGKLLSLAFTEATKLKGCQINKVQIIIGECYNLLDVINNSKV